MIDGSVLARWIHSSALPPVFSVMASQIWRAISRRRSSDWALNGAEADDAVSKVLRSPAPGTVPVGAGPLGAWGDPSDDELPDPCDEHAPDTKASATISTIAALREQRIRAINIPLR